MKKNIMLWILGGLLSVGGAFFLSGYSGDIWSAVIAGSIAALLYLIAFTAVWITKINTSAKRKGIISVLVVLVVGCSVFGMISYEDSVRQRQLLKDIRLTVESGVAYNYVHEPLLKTFRLYHTSAGEENLKEIFTASFDSLISDDSLYRYRGDREEANLNIHVEEVSDDRIVLVGESKYVAGRNQDFTNYSGKTGKFQTKGILTSEGVHYEREN